MVEKSGSRQNAGEFSYWLDEFFKTMEGKGEGCVPCGECTGCCTSSKFIHIKPTDIAALQEIPEEIMFPAPGLPRGHYLLGYDENGHCPMFRDGKCSIYQSRPATCRQYDCRIYAATGVSAQDESTEISNRVRTWDFQFNSDEDREKYRAVRMAAEFLSENRNRFPDSHLPVSNSRLAVLAIRIHREFIGEDRASIENRSEAIVSDIVQELRLR